MLLFQSDYTKNISTIVTLFHVDIIDRAMVVNEFNLIKDLNCIKVVQNSSCYVTGDTSQIEAKTIENISIERQTILKRCDLLVLMNKSINSQ